MPAPMRPTPYGVRRAEVWLDMHGAAVSAMTQAEALASYAAPLEQVVEEADRLRAALRGMLAEYSSSEPPPDPHGPGEHCVDCAARAALKDTRTEEHQP